MVSRIGRKEAISLLRAGHILSSTPKYQKTAFSTAVLLIAFNGNGFSCYERARMSVNGRCHHDDRCLAGHDAAW